MSKNYCTYQIAYIALDSISLVGALVAGTAVIKAFKLIQKNSGRTTKQILKSVTRAEKRRLTKDIVRLNNPNNPNKSTKALKAILNTEDSKNMYTKLKITKALKLHLKDGVGAALTFSGSAFAGFSSNQIKAIAVTVFE